MDEALIAKYAEAAKLAAQQLLPKAKLKPADAVVTNVGIDLQKYADAALAEQQKKRERTAKPSSQLPEERLTLQLIKDVYQKTGIKPARSIYWFYEDRSINPLIQRSLLDDDRKVGSPLGALVISKAQQMQAPPEWTKELTDYWVTGQIAQFTGFSCSYILGFESGFDGHPPGHRLCSYHYHCGYADGKIAYTFLQKEGLITETGSEDPFRAEDEADVLNELVRVKGYWRNEWGPKPKFLIDTVDLTEERLLELGLATAAGV